MKHLPKHPSTGITAIGWRKARSGEEGEQPIWPLLGGSEAADGDDTADGGGEEGESESEDGEEAVEGEDALGDAGKRALDAMKATLRAEKARRKAAESKAAALEASKADGDDDKTDLGAVRAEALKQARTETLRERTLDRLEARARKFNDSADARAHLASRVEEFIDGEQIDNAAIDEALAELLEAKPYLGTGSKPRFEGTGDGGARKGGNGVKQLGQADLKRMTADQIVAAQKAGQFDEFLATET